jgi:hypothetical protein
MKGLIKNELVRLLISPRWLIIIPAALMPAHLYGVDLARAFNFNHTNIPALNVWDGFMLTFSAGAVLAFSYFFLLAFAFIIGDRFVGDKDSGYLSWLVIRANKKKIWTAKILAVLIAALIFSGLYMVIVAGYNAAFLPMSFEGSQIACDPAVMYELFRITTSQQTIDFYQNVSPFVIFVLSALFAGLGLGAITSALLYLTLLVQKSFVPMIIAALLAIFAPLFTFSGILGLHPATRLSFDFHVGFGNIEPQMTFYQTISVWILLVVLSIYLGNRKIKKLEI